MLSMLPSVSSLANIQCHVAVERSPDVLTKHRLTAQNQQTIGQHVAETLIQISKEEVAVEDFLRMGDHTTSKESQDLSQEQQIQPIGKDEQDESQSGTKLYDLPLEILDTILQKSYLHWILNSSSKERDEEVIRCLTSVDVCFHRRTIRQRYKKAIWRCLGDFYRKTKKRPAIIRNNGKYFSQTIQPNDEFIASLLSLECITEEQSQVIQRQHSNKAKNMKLLQIVRSFDETKSSNFVRCLRRTEQKTVARIMENGGGVIKVRVQICGTTPMEARILHQKIENLPRRMIPISLQIDRFLRQLKEEGIEILNSQLNGQTVVVWIWCRSQEALQKIQRLYKSNQLRDVIFENIQPSVSKVVNIDRNQFKKTVVVLFPISINSSQRRDVQVHERVHGVTKLRNEIYVLCRAKRRNSRTIRVLDDRSPFRTQSKIRIKQTKSPEDIVSSVKDNCLYVSDSESKCVWKIERVLGVTKLRDDQYRIIKWIFIDYAPRTLSVSTDGQLLMINEASSVLMIYGSDAQLIRFIQLPTYILRPIHAVKTSIGNFVILYSRWEEKKGESGSGVREVEMKACICEWNEQNLTVISRFIPSNEEQQLNEACYLSLDSDDRVFAADYANGRVILLNYDLTWNGISCPTGQKEETKMKSPRRLCYDEEKKQLIVGGYIDLREGLGVYTFSRNEA